MPQRYSFFQIVRRRILLIIRLWWQFSEKTTVPGRRGPLYWNCGKYIFSNMSSIAQIEWGCSFKDFTEKDRYTQRWYVFRILACVSIRRVIGLLQKQWTLRYVSSPSANIPPLDVRPRQLFCGPPMPPLYKYTDSHIFSTYIVLF